MKTPEEWCDTENKQVWLEPHFIRSVQSDARADLEAENKALRDSQRITAKVLADLEAEILRCRERAEKAEAACAEMRAALLGIRYRENCMEIPAMSVIEHARSSNCGQPLLDKLKAMEEENKTLRKQLDRYAIEHPTICYECGNVVPKP